MLAKLGSLAGVVVGSTVLLLGGLMVVGMGAKAVTTVHAVDRTREEPAQAVAAQPAAPSPLDTVMSASSFGGAYRAAQPYISDTTDQVSPGAALLALWMARHGQLRDVLPGLGKVTVKHAKKDIAAARGEPTCVRGTIIQIQRDPTAANLHMGLLMTPAGDVVHYFAAGSTGDLVDDDTAKFCGVITGTYAFANVSGGQTQSVQLVGMFDLDRAR